MFNEDKTSLIITDFKILETSSNIIQNAPFLPEKFFIEIARDFFQNTFQETQASSQPAKRVVAQKPKSVPSTQHSSKGKIINARKRILIETQPGKTANAKKTRSKVDID